jgi:hypothetical protein
VLTPALSQHCVCFIGEAANMREGGDFLLFLRDFFFIGMLI